MKSEMKINRGSASSATWRRFLKDVTALDGGRRSRNTQWVDFYTHDAVSVLVPAQFSFNPDQR